MRKALDLAGAAEREGEVPVGAVLVAENGQVLATAHNRPISACDPTAHAEIEVLRAGARAVGNYRLTGTTLYVTLEPCAMCTAAMVHARVRRLVYGAADPKAGAAGSVFDLTGAEALNHRIERTAGVLEAECRARLQAFFRARRD